MPWKYQRCLENILDTEASPPKEMSSSEKEDLSKARELYTKEAQERVGKLKFPTPIPLEEENPKLRHIVQQKLLLIETSAFVEIAVSFLENLKPYPTTGEYDAYAATLIEKYPELADKTKPTTMQHLTLKKMLTTKMRNERCRRKHRLSHPPKAKKRGAIYASSSQSQPKRATEPVESTSQNQSDNCEENLIDGDITLGVPVDELLDMLEKEIKDKATLESILLKTLDKRQMFIKSAKFIKDIVTLWPNMKTPEAVRADHVQLECIDKKVEEENYEKLVKFLANFFKCEEDFDTNMACQANLFLKLEQHLHGKVSRLHPKLFTILKVGGVTPDKIASNAPIIVAYTQKKIIQKGFILAEGFEIVQFSKPTMFDLLKHLMGSYYTYHVKYPPAYSHILPFIDYCVYSKPMDVTSRALTQLKAEFHNV